MHEIDTLKYTIKEYEAAFREISSKNNLCQFLDENEWATTEDYLHEIAFKALKADPNCV